MFWERFTALCAAKGVKPTTAGRQMGFSKGSISYWKRKYLSGVDAGPDSYTAAKLADCFGVSVDYLLGRTEDAAKAAASLSTRSALRGRTPLQKFSRFRLRLAA